MSLHMKLYLSCLLSSLVGTGGTHSPRDLATSPVRSAEGGSLLLLGYTLVTWKRGVSLTSIADLYNNPTDSPLPCPAGYTQTVDGDAINFIACCNAVNCYNDWHTCVDYGGNACPYPSICSQVYTAYTSCPHNSPACVVYKRITGPQDSMQLTSYGCGATASQILVLGTATGGDGAASGMTSSATSITASSTASSTMDSASTSTTTSTTSSATRTPIGSATSSTTRSTTSNKVSSKTTGSTSSMPSSTSSGIESPTSAPQTSSSTSSSPPSQPTSLDPGAIAGIVGAVVATIGILVTIFLRFPVQSLRFITCSRYPRARVRTADGGSRPPNDYEMRGRILHRRRAEDLWIENQSRRSG